MKREQRICVMCGREATHIAEETGELLCSNCYEINEQIKMRKIRGGY